MVHLSPNAGPGAFNKTSTFGVTVNGIHKDLLSLCAAPGAGCTADGKDAIYRILVDVSEIGHIREAGPATWAVFGAPDQCQEALLRPLARVGL